MLGGIGMNKKIFAAAVAAALLMTGCKAADTTESSVPASAPSETEASAASESATPTPTATPTPADDVPSLEEMTFEEVVTYIVDGNLMTDQDVIDLYGGTPDPALPQTVAEYVEECVEEANDYYLDDANADAGIVNIAEINDYGYNDSGEFTRWVQIRVVEVDPDTIGDYKVGGSITIHNESYLEYYDENDELVVEENDENEDWPIAAISGNYILVAQEYVSEDDINTAAPFEDEELQAAYEAFDALG